MKRILSSIVSIILCLCMVVSLCPAMVFAESAPNYTLKFDNNGKFKILVLADCQDDSNPDQRMITMIGKALDYEKPDLVVFLGDNIVVTTQSAFKTGLKKLMAPLVARNIPYAYVYGNHDDQSALISKSFMHSEYKKVGTCLTYDADPDLTGCGTCNLPVMSSDGSRIAFNLWMIDSNTYTDSSKDYYDNVHQDQLNWYTSKSMELENQAGHKVNSLVFQHIIVPEAYNLLVENPNGGKTYNGKTYELTLNSRASGYLGEFPCPPRDNSGELNTMAARGDVLGIVTGHDHKNSFIGRWNNIDLIQTSGMTYESYGSDEIRGYRTITIDENNTSRYETDVVTYVQEAAGALNPIATGNGIPDEYYYPEGTQFISDVAIGYGTSKKEPALNALTNTGFTPINKDLNADAGGAYIYMGYKLTNNYSESIKALRFSVLGESGYGSTKTSVINNNNVGFNIVSEGGDGIVDLNKDAGGAYIYAYYTKDCLAGSAISSISFSNSSTPPANSETATIFSNVACPAELNAGTSSAPIFCHYSVLAKVNSSALRQAYNSTSGLNASNYTTASYNTLQSARSAAKVIIDKLDAEHASTYSQAAINSAASAINTAYANLAHTVTYKNDDGSVLNTEEVIHGRAATYSVIPTKPDTAQYSYTFKGWSASLASVTSNMTVTAEYNRTLKSYAVIFKNENGTVLQTLDVNYGTVPSYSGQTPVKAATDSETYTFIGWYPALSAVTGDQTYTARYNASPRKYTVTFKNYDGQVLQQGEWAYGTDPSYYGQTPVKEATDAETYTFIGWYPAISAVAGDQTYTARYNASPRKYTVTFQNYNGQVLQQGEWVYGTVPSYIGQTPVKEATDAATYTFAGWSPEVREVTGAAVYTAQYSATEKQYTVTFKNGEEILQSSSWKYGETPVYTKTEPRKEATDEFSYEFAGWDPEISEVTGNAVYYAVFTPVARKYNVTFKNYDGQVLQQSEWAYGTVPEYLPIPEMPEDEYAVYNFTGWDPEISEVKGEAIYIAQFSPEYKFYTYKFFVDGAEIPELEITQQYGTAVTAPVYTPAEGYDFSGWSDEVPLSMGAEDRSFYGTTSPKMITVSFDLNGGTGAAPVAVTAAFGTSVDLPGESGFANPGFEFKGWAVTAEASEPLSGFIAPAVNVTLYAVWALIPVIHEPELVVPEESDIYVDEEKAEICGIPENTSLRAFEAQLTVNGGYAEIEALGRAVGTGTVINVYDNNGDLFKSYTVIIFGDLDGNGRVNANDVAMARQAVTEGFENSVYETAANILRPSKRDRFNLADIAALMAAITEEPLDQAELAQIYEEMG